MKLNEYQAAAKTFAIYSNPEYAFDNLFAEAGEIAVKIAKIKRGDVCEWSAHNVIDYLNDDKLARAAILKELGDVLWQLSACCNELDASLEHVAQLNIGKLQSRQERSKLDGSGDNR